MRKTLADKNLISIFTYASAECGYGHLRRCLVLAEELTKQSISVNIYLNQDSEVEVYLSKREKNHRIEFFFTGNEKLLGPCIVDLPASKQHLFVGQCKRHSAIVYFDDVNYIVPPYCHGVINHNLFADRSSYPENVKCFVGASYFLLDQEYTRWKKIQSSNPHKILICAGGSDPTNQTETLVEIARAASDRQIQVVLGPGFKDKNHMKRWGSYKNVNCFQNPSNLVEVISQSAFAIIGGGTMLYEVAFLGIPSCALALAEDQRSNIQGFHARGASIDLGFWKDLDALKAVDIVKKVNLDHALRNRMSKRASNLIDGKGPYRLAKEILDWMF